MNKLKIELNNNIEIVNTNTISKLYNVTKSIPEPKEDEEDKAYLSGNLLVNKSYRFQVDYLMNRFKDLNINVGNYYIEIEDPEVLRVLLANNIGDGIGVTTEEASTTAINLIFKNNTVIENFDEFKYFKGNYTLSHTFNGCINLKSVTIPSSANLISSLAFLDCSSLTSIIIPNSVTTIGRSAFSGCSSLTSVTIPNSVTTIDNEAFHYCSNLTSVTIGNGVTSIGSNAFEDCSGLTSIVVENGNTKYDSRDNCNAIIETASNTLIRGFKTTVIPNSVTAIGSWAFFKCSGLTSITIPNSVTSISDSAFRSCSGLTSITIPNSVTSISDSAFLYCVGLTSVTINSNSIISKTYSSESNLKNIFGIQIKSYIIGDGVTSIGDYAFWNCYSLTSITIPNSVTSIGDYAFYKCSRLTSITIPNSVTSIGSNAFEGCSSLTTITSLATTAPTIQSSTFQNVKTGGTLRVPSGSTGYDEWMNYLGSRGWTKVEQ